MYIFRQKCPVDNGVNASDVCTDDNSMEKKTPTKRYCRKVSGVRRPHTRGDHFILFSAKTAFALLEVTSINHATLHSSCVPMDTGVKLITHFCQDVTSDVPRDLILLAASKEVTLRAYDQYRHGSTSTGNADNATRTRTFSTAKEFCQTFTSA
jgi:hypothetical protein